MVDFVKTDSEMNAAYKAGDFDAAYTLAKQIVEADPKHHNGLRHLARLATNRREQEVALSAWSALSEVEPDAHEPWLQLARIAQRDGKSRECRAHVERLLVLQPDNVEARTMHVECLLKARDEKNILAAFEALCDLETKNLGRLARIAVNYGMGADIALTLRRLAQAGDQEAINLCDTMFRSERDAGVGFEIQKNPFSAAKCYRNMRVLRPESDYPQTSLARLRRPFLERARRAYSSAEYDRAIEHAHSCIKIDNHEAEPYIIAGRAAQAAGDQGKSFDILKRGVEKCGADGWLKVNFARAAARQSLLLDAIEAYVDVLSLTDEKTKNYHDEAKTEIERLTARLPQWALREARDENFTAAIDAVNYLSQKAPEDDEINRIKANVVNLVQRKLRELYDAEDQSAVDLADELIAFDEALPYPYRVAGRIEYRNGNLERSREYWNKLTALDGDSVEFWLMKARCSLGLRDAADADIAAQAVLNLDGNHEEAARILKAAS